MGSSRRQCLQLYLTILHTVTVILSIYVSCSDAGSYDNMHDLHRHLLTNYSRTIRPLEDQSRAVNVRALYTLKSLNGFDAVNGHMVTTGSLFIIWTDERIHWNSSQYGDIDMVSLPGTDVWTPTFIVANGADDIYIKGITREDIAISYTSQGMATFLLSGIITTSCDPDITYYPYDVHKCNIQFATQEFKHEVDLSLYRLYILPGADTNLLWKLGETDYRTYLVQNTSRFIEVMFTLERRPNYLVLTILFPICMLTFINLLAFVLPADSGERVSFATTMLLTLSVYMTIMSDSIPNTSDPVSILTISIMIKLILSSLITLTVILSLNVYRVSDAKPVPRWLLKLMCYYGKIQSKDENNGRHSQPIDLDVELRQKSTTNSQEACANEIDHGTARMKCPKTWRDVGRTLDYVLLVVFALITVTETVFNVVRISQRIG